MPTPYGQSVIRIVTDNTTADLDRVHTLQDQLEVKAVPRSLYEQATVPPLNMTLFKDPYYRAGNDTELSEAVMRLTAKLAPYNEPEVLKDRECVAQMLVKAGCVGDVWMQPFGTNMTTAIAAANQSVAILLAQPEYKHDVGNGWYIFDSGIVGDYQSYYQARYFITSWGYLALTEDQAIYPSSKATPEIGPDQALVVHFSGRPVLEDTGFWSLTVYGEDLFFVPNQLNRYALGDRSNLTFPDGSLVYAKGTSDGPFDILIQPADIEPPANWTSNWIPVPAGGGTIEWNCELLPVFERPLLTRRSTLVRCARRNARRNIRVPNSDGC